MLSFLNGKKVNHTKFGAGVVSSTDGNMVSIKFKDGEKKFAFPISFINNSFLKADDVKIQSQLEELVLKAKKEETENKEKKNEERITKAQNATLGSVERFMQTDAGKRLSEVKIGDEFENIKDVMDSVFGWNYRQYMKGFYFLDDSERYGVWFPKFSKDGKTPGDKTSDWLNILSSDGKTIYMKNVDISKMNSIEGFPVHFTFGKMPGEKYKYAGAFMRTHFDPELGYVYEKID